MGLTCCEGIFLIFHPAKYNTSIPYNAMTKYVGHIKIICCENDKPLKLRCAICVWEFPTTSEPLI